jgi:hypothetical protein
VLTALTFTCLIYSGDQIKKNEVRRHVARKGQRRGAYRVLVGKPEGKKPTGKFRYIWGYNNKMDFQKVGWGLMNWIDQA